ncbi:acyl-coenzyme A diphosphatase FITM2-like [Planococcus citri]|uniref:acyl-coenzyme A diphosphatase FITM2-like n=1 Tax=Planococcus citri TaxID=170843 RepID=UPI0031FA0E90
MFGILLPILTPISFLNASYVAIFYMFYASTLSIVFTYVHLPDSYFNQNDNHLNVYFMKYSYIYATGLLLPFVCVLHYVLNYASCKKSMFAFLRVFIFAFINYCIGEEFNILGFFFGACDMYSYYINDKVQCIKNGYQWTKLDISGHVFHILYSILVIYEELSFLRNWRSIESKVNELIIDDDDDSSDENPITVISRERFNIFKKIYVQNQYFLKTCMVFLSVLVILLHLSVFITLVYFHTAFEKIVAMIIALVFWFFSYHIIYPLGGFRTGPYSIETAEYESLMEKSGEFSLIYANSTVDGRYPDRNNIFNLFARNPRSKTYEIL